ncbi:unnamed protein product [Symbiodinium microadriaticum]|nr:unnamed protein product [Symbiodinium microadriaticum]
MARGWKARVVLKPAMTPLPCHLDLLASGRPPFPMRWGHGMGAWGYSNQVVERKLIQALREERRDMREKQTAIGEDAERQLQLQLPGMKRKRSPEPEAVCDAPARECNLSPATPMQDQPQEHITTPEKKAHTTPRITPEKTPRPTEADHASPLTAETTAAKLHLTGSDGYVPHPLQSSKPKRLPKQPKAPTVGASIIHYQYYFGGSAL